MVDQVSPGVGGGVLLAGGEARILTGIANHPRLSCAPSRKLREARPGPFSACVAAALRRPRYLQEILTGNGKVFSGWFGPRDGHRGAVRPDLRREVIDQLLTGH
jgi:hypothetical protein